MDYLGSVALSRAKLGMAYGSGAGSGVHVRRLSLTPGNHRESRDTVANVWLA